MKRKIVLFFFAIFFALGFVALSKTISAKAYASDEIVFEYENKVYTPSEPKQKLSNIRQHIIESPTSERVEVMNQIYAYGFTKKDAILYAFPEIYEAECKIRDEVRVEPIDATPVSLKNGNIKIENAKMGRKLDENHFFDMVFYKLNENKEKNFKVKIKTKEVKPAVEDISEWTHLRASFTTNFSSSSEGRKNNIRRALESLDSIKLEPNKRLSFNETTGIRDEQHGYQKAKIIKNGAFVSEFGGGVCQVSTTLYNACLLADLDIVEVHQHSLPVSYVAPCFDAMVNGGGSDLIIENNTKFPIFITTSCLNDNCLVNIYGAKSEFQIVRKSEKTEELNTFMSEKTKDYLSYGFSQPLRRGEEKIVCYFKPGYKAIGTLEYYKNGALVRKKKIRENTYSPTKQITLVG